mmetsp:Transcript_30056/g.82535  ORF Transcript_30056/g.82535 Transcript_30056/m.82535 type:complete len:255 (+) Transcript_30056:104-868(+)
MATSTVLRGVVQDEFFPKQGAYYARDDDGDGNGRVFLGIWTPAGTSRKRKELEMDTHWNDDDHDDCGKDIYPEPPPSKRARCWDSDDDDDNDGSALDTKASATFLRFCYQQQMKQQHEPESTWLNHNQSSTADASSSGLVSIVQVALCIGTIRKDDRDGSILAAPLAAICTASTGEEDDDDYEESSATKRKTTTTVMMHPTSVLRRPHCGIRQHCGDGGRPSILWTLLYFLALVLHWLTSSWSSSFAKTKTKRY